MDVELWVYIIIGIIYFLSRLLKKGEEVTAEGSDPSQPQPKPRSNRPQPTAETPRPLTFEELLREITEGKQAKKPEPVPVPEYEPYEKDPGEEARSLEDVRVDEEKQVQRWKAYEEIPAHTSERISLEETLRLEDTVVDFRKFEAFEQREEKRVRDEYLKIIRNPETLKQAVVISEILKRKF